MTTPTRTERNSAVTIAPADPTTPVLYGPDGQALTAPAPPATDWQPVRSTGNAVVWERPRETVTLERIPAEPDTHDAAAAIIDAAQARADELLLNAQNDATKLRDRAAAETAKKTDRAGKLDMWMARAAIAAAVGLTASGEYSLARLAHFPKEVAWLLPFVIDIYVIQAFRRHRDIPQAIGLTIAANVVYHLAAAGLFGVTTDTHGSLHAEWWLIALVASIASVILWRMHVITVPPKPKKERRHTGTQAARDRTADPVPTPPLIGTGTSSDQQEHASVPVPASATERVPGTASVPVPKPVPDTQPVPLQQPVLTTAPTPVPSRRGTGTKTRRSAPRSTAPKTGTGTASFDDHVETARGWLADAPSLSGTDIGKRLGTGDSYGRRVKRAATQTS